MGRLTESNAYGQKRELYCFGYICDTRGRLTIVQYLDGGEKKDDYSQNKQRARN